LAADEIAEARRTLPEHVFQELFLAEAAADGLAMLRGCVVRDQVYAYSNPWQDQDYWQRQREIQLVVAFRRKAEARCRR
jgi:hypothetical protein